jgi:hypothetical protein
MTVITEQPRNNRREVARFMLAYRKLPVEKKARVNTLIDLLEKSEDNDEQAEIALAIAEIIIPEDIFGDSSAASIVDLEAGVTDQTRDRVDNYKRHIGDEIRRRREAKGLTQAQLSERCGLPQSHICRLELGQHAPTRATIERIAKALETEPSQLDLLFD